MEPQENIDITGEIYSKFLLAESLYATRNSNLDGRRAAFDGEHWDELDTNANINEYRLTFNYVRRIILGYVALFAHSPRPRVRLPAGTLETKKANQREKLLQIYWDDLMRVWYDVEINAAKLSYGVLQAVWAPEPGQPKSRDIGTEEQPNIATAYTQNPFFFRSIPPKLFYPIYRTYKDANDFQEVYRSDPGRLVEDLEKRYHKDLSSVGYTDPNGNMIVSIAPTCDLVEKWTKEKYVLLAITQVTYEKTGRRRGSEDKYGYEERYTVLEDMNNEYGRIPFWVVQNIRTDPQENPTIKGSISDMDDMFALNKHINHILSEEAEGIVTNIHSPIIYKSDEFQQDPNNIVRAAGAVIPIGLEEEMETLEPPRQPAETQEHIDRVSEIMRDLAFLGDAGFGRFDSGASGVAARVALTPMQQLVELKMPPRLDTLRSVCAFLLETTETKLRATAGATLDGYVLTEMKRFGMVSIKPEDIAGAYYSDIDYGNLLPRDEMAFEQNEVYKRVSGAQSLRMTLDNMGHEDPDAEVARIKEENADIELNPDKAMQIIQAKQLQASMQAPPPTGATTPPAEGGGGGVPPTGAPTGEEQIPGAGGPGLEGPNGLGGGRPEQFDVRARPGWNPSSQTAPIVPNSEGFPRQGGAGPKRLAPFMNRGK